MSKPQVTNEVQLGISHLKDGNLDAAQSIFSRLADEEPDLAVARFGLGQVYFRRGENEKAFEMFQEALALEPNSAAAKVSSARGARAAGGSRRRARGI